MAVKIRLRRVGAKKQPSYRLVATDERSPRDGRFIEIVGHYNPLTDPPTISIKEDRVAYWLSQGAQPSESAAKLLSKTSLSDKVPAPKGKSEKTAQGSDEAKG